MLQSIFTIGALPVPPVTFTAFYGQHASAQEAEQAAEHIRQADIIFPEYIGWDTLPPDILEKLDRPDMIDNTARTPNFPEFSDPLFENIRREHKLLGFADIPTTDQLFTRLESVRDALFEEPRREIESGRPFAEAFEHWKRSVDEWTAIQLQRERYILAHIGPELERILIKHPELSSKDALRVLLVLGAGHTNIGRTLRERGDVAVSRLSMSPFVFRFALAQALRAKTFNGEIPDTLYKRSFAEGLVLDSLDAVPSMYQASPEEKDQMAQAMAAKMTFDDAKRLYEARVRGEGQTDAFFSEILERRFRLTRH